MPEIFSSCEIPKNAGFSLIKSFHPTFGTSNCSTKIAEDSDIATTLALQFKVGNLGLNGAIGKTGQSLP